MWVQQPNQLLCFYVTVIDQLYLSRNSMLKRDKGSESRVIFNLLTGGETWL